jgi:hypothetical protein
MRSLVLVPVYPCPQASGHHGAHLALLSVYICYFPKVKGFMGVDQLDN